MNNSHVLVRLHKASLTDGEKIASTVESFLTISNNNAKVFVDNVVYNDENQIQYFDIVAKCSAKLAVLGNACAWGCAAILDQ